MKRKALKATAFVLGIVVIIGAACAIILQRNQAVQEVQQEKFIETLIKAYAPIQEGVQELGLAVNENTDYYTDAMLEFADLFLELPNHYSSLDVVEEDLQSLGFVFCYRGAIDQGETQWDYLLVHFACPLPVFGTIECNWNYLYFTRDETIQCAPLFTQSNIILNNITALIVDHTLIFQLEGRETNYHPYQLFLGFLAVDEDGTVTPLRVYPSMNSEDIEADTEGQSSLDVRIYIDGRDDLTGDLYFNECGAEIWLYDGLLAEVTQDRNIVVSFNDRALEEGVSEAVIAHFEISTDGVLLNVYGEHE